MFLLAHFATHQLSGPTTPDTQRAAALFRIVLPLYVKLIEKEAPDELLTLNFRSFRTNMCETTNSQLREQNSTFTCQDFSYIFPSMLNIAFWRRSKESGYFRLNKKTGNVIDKYALGLSFALFSNLPLFAYVH